MRKPIELQGRVKATPVASLDLDWQRHDSMARVLSSSRIPDAIGTSMHHKISSFPLRMRGIRWAAPALLALHVVLLAVGAALHSPTVDEVAYLPAGLSHWQFGRFELYRANPPLVRPQRPAPSLPNPTFLCMPDRQFARHPSPHRPARSRCARRRHAKTLSAIACLGASRMVSMNGRVLELTRQSRRPV